MATSAVLAFRAALKAAIVARLTTDAVTATVFSYPPGDNAPGTDYVYLEDDSPTQEVLAFGGSRVESITLDGVVTCRRPGAGDTEAATADAASIAIVASIEAALRADPTVTGTVFDAEFATGPGSPLAQPNERIQLRRFTVTAEAHI